jgi:hypothetical protein
VAWSDDRGSVEPRLVVFVQFSDRLLTPHSPMRDYYQRSYARMPGYYLPPHFMEIPFWIPTAAAMLRSVRGEQYVHIVEDLDATARMMSRADPADVFLFSVMDASLRQTLELARSGATMVCGGYTDPRDFDSFPNVRYLGSIDELSGVLPDVLPTGSRDYSLFRGLPCIPRLSFSSGCSYRCAFCTVPAKLVMAPEPVIERDIAALEPLDFRLVFLDDKSFGEAPNWPMVTKAGPRLAQLRRDFLGFIVQMPPSLACRSDFLASCAAAGVRYVEFGIEVVNDALLRWMHKPFRVRHLEEACRIARSLGLYVIPNMIIGIPGDDYRATQRWLEENVDIVPVVNVNWLSVHYGNERGDLGLPAGQVADRDQNSPFKSWLSAADVSLGLHAIENMYDTTDRYWSRHEVRLLDAPWYADVSG